MKLIILLIGLTLGMLITIIGAESEYPGKIKHMKHRQCIWKEMGMRTEDKAKHARQEKEESGQFLKEKREQWESDKIQTIKKMSIQKNEEQMNEQMCNIKSKNQNKEHIKYGDTKHLGEESYKKNSNSNYKKDECEKKTNKEYKIKEIEDYYDSECRKIKEGNTKNEERTAENIKIKKGTIKEQNANEQGSMTQEYKNNILKETSKSEKYKLPKKQHKNKSGKKYKTRKEDYSDEEILEENKRQVNDMSNKQYKKYDDDHQDLYKNKVEKYEKPRTTKQQKYKDEHIFKDYNEVVEDNENIFEEKMKPEMICTKESSVKCEEDISENDLDMNSNFPEETLIKTKCPQSKYKTLSVDSFQKENEKMGETLMNFDENDLQNYNKEDIAIEEQDGDKNGRINKESTIVILEWSDGTITENNPEIENLEAVKLRVLRKYQLVEVTDNVEDESKSSNKYEKILEEQLYSKIYMYIVGEEFDGHQIIYAVEQDNREASCSFPEVEIEDTL